MLTRAPNWPQVDKWNVENMFKRNKFNFNISSKSGFCDIRALYLANMQVLTRNDAVYKVSTVTAFFSWVAQLEWFRLHIFYLLHS